jgi:putative aldouronate transport system substrate-binding protein
MMATGNAAAGVLVGGYTGVHPGLLVTVGQKDRRDFQYDALPPLRGPAGDRATFNFPSSPGATFVMTKAATEEEQQTIMAILNYMFTEEGHLRAQFGEEGIGWRPAKPGEIALDTKLKPSFVDLPLDESNPEDYNGNWGAMAQYIETEEFRNSQVQPMDINQISGFERRLFDATKPYEGKEGDASFPYWNAWVSQEAAAELSTLQTNVETYIVTSSAEFVTGTRDPNDDGAWQEFLEGLDGLGAARYVEIWQTAHDG